MTRTTLHAQQFRFRFRNPKASEMNLWIEPLGDLVMIPSQGTVEVRCTEEFGPNEVEMTEDCIAVHGWVQSVLSVSETGELRPVWDLATGKI